MGSMAGDSPASTKRCLEGPSDSSEGVEKDPKLAALDMKSRLLTEKIERIGEVRDRIYATKGYDHPSVTELNEQIQVLGRKLRNVSAQRYAYSIRSTPRSLSCNHVG